MEVNHENVQNVLNIVNYSPLDAFCRNSWKRSRKTRTRLKSARKMRRLTSTQSRYVLVYLALQQNEVCFLV